MSDDHRADAAWIDANCVDTSYETGAGVIIITTRDETDLMMIKLRWGFC